MHRSLPSAVLSLSVLLSSLAVAQNALYTFTTIDVPGARGTYATDINDGGQIVGYFDDATGTHGFLKDGDTFTTLDVPGAMSTFANGINHRGQIVGGFSIVESSIVVNHGFVTDGTTYTPIDVPGARQTIVNGINDGGQIVGYFVTPAEIRGFVTDGTTYTPIDVPGTQNTWAYGINDGGQIVGSFQDATLALHGFVTDGTTYTPIDIPGARRTDALGINDGGQIVGDFISHDNRYHGFLKDGDTFTTLDVPGASGTLAQGINAAGQIVGYYSDSSGTHGFVATPRKADTTPPVMTVSASPSTLWPPNGQLVPVIVSGTITDEADGSGVKTDSGAYTVIDEYSQIQPSGTFEADGSYTFTVELEASRRGNDRDGRRYTIVVSATDKAGNLGSASTTVTVPRN